MVACIKETFTESKDLEFAHLRRYAKFNALPAILQSRFEELFPIEGEDGGPNAASSAAKYLYLLAVPSSTPSDSLLETLAELNSCADGSDNSVLATPPSPVLLTASIPRSSPISAAQAAGWSEQFWPCVYKNTNPYGPHPKILRDSTATVSASAPQFLALAERGARQCAATKSGLSVGCVVIERQKDGGAEVIAVAGDGRYCGTNSSDSSAENVMAHAAMRAIGMVARKRLRVDEDVAVTAQEAEPPSSYVDLPLNELEKRFFALNNILPKGYLCLNLEIYLTHEPCVMCAMAILHSRFASCVFRRTLPRTGAMTIVETAESNSLGYGLSWHQELNWKFLAWRWQDEDTTDMEDDARVVHA